MIFCSNYLLNKVHQCGMMLFYWCNGEISGAYTGSYDELPVYVSFRCY